MILGVTSPAVAAKSSKKSCVVSVIALVPENSGVPPSVAGVWLRVTLSVWVRRYSVGLNMHAISVSPAGMLSPVQTSLALSGLSSPRAPPIALAAEPTASMTMAAASEAHGR